MEAINQSILTWIILAPLAGAVLVEYSFFIGAIGCMIGFTNSASPRRRAISKRIILAGADLAATPSWRMRAQDAVRKSRNPLNTKKS